MAFLHLLARGIDRLNDSVGRATAWLALLMVLVQFVVVVMRYVFGMGSIKMQESIVYMHGMLFLLAAGYTLLKGGHVRIDIFYRTASPRRRALVDLMGVLVFLLPVCIMLFWIAWPYVSSSWSVLEGSKEASGIQGVYLLKTMILVFAVLMALQGLSMAIHALLTLLGREREGGKGMHLLY